VLNIKFHKQSKIEPVKLLEIVKGTEGAQFTPAGVLRLPLNGIESAPDILGYLARLFAT
jgi:transcription-repair coupling factor (superfamily II helicase)